MDKNKRRSQLLPLFLTFLKIGAFTFGGGYAMIPLIQRETVEGKKWITDEDMLEIIAIAESTPGPLAINSATFVGSHVAGVPGAACATLGVILPSFVIILIVSTLLDAFQHVKAVQYAFFGIRAGVLALILRAFWTMYKPPDGAAANRRLAEDVAIGRRRMNVSPTHMGSARGASFLVDYAATKQKTFT